MAGEYDLKVYATTTAPTKWSKDTAPVKREPNGAGGYAMAIPRSVNSKSIENETPYNGYNDVVRKIDPSKTKVEKSDGIFFDLFLCRVTTISYFDKNGKLLCKRVINSKDGTDHVEFKGTNGNYTRLWDNNHNGNFEKMSQDSQSGRFRSYEWTDDSDNRKGNYHRVKLTNYSYHRNHYFK